MELRPKEKFFGVYLIERSGFKITIDIWGQVIFSGELFKLIKPSIILPVVFDRLHQKVAYF